MKSDIFSQSSYRGFYEKLRTNSASLFKSSLLEQTCDINCNFSLALRNCDLEVSSEFENSSVTSNRRFYEKLRTNSASLFKLSLLVQTCRFTAVSHFITKQRLGSYFEI
jgi:hypothetical protein